MALFFSISTTDIDRKSLKRPDDFEAVAKDFFDEIQKHSRPITFGLVVLFIIGLGAAYYMNHREQISESASNALFKANETLQSELTAIAAKEPVKAPPKADSKSKEKTPPKPDAATVEYKKVDVDSQLAGAVQQYEAISKAYNGTRAGFEAQIALGDLYYKHGSPEKGIPYYEAAVKSAPASSEKALALYALGYANENAGKFQDAVASYEKAMNLGQLGLKADLLLAMARCYELMHDTAKAKSTYDQVISQFSTTDYAKTAELRKAQLK